MAGNTQDPASELRVSSAPTTTPQSGMTSGSAPAGAAASVPATPAKAVTATPATATTASGVATTVGQKSSKPVVNAALRRRPRQPVPGRAATVVAVIAVLVALGSGLVALYSLNVARQAKSSAASAASDAQRLTNQPPRTQAAPSAPAGSASATPTPSPTPTFPHELRAVDLTIPPTVGCQSLFVDADTGQVGNYS